MRQKPFSVYRSAFTSSKLPFAFFILFLGSCFLILESCSFNPPLQQKGEVVLQGIWQQDTIKANNKLVTYSLYNFKFNCDSFFVQINSFSKVNYGADTCMKSGKWVEYARGTYILTNDTVRLKGQFCNANNSLKKEGTCFRYGNYEEAFKIKKTADSIYQFLNLAAVTAFNIHLKKKLTCIPKPL